jgi:two-component system, NtrC family, sensor kinase
VIERSTRYQMLHNDREALYHIIGAFGSEPGIRRVRIFNEEGRISFSTERAEVDRVVDKRAEACFACHSSGSPLTRLARPDRARVFTDANGERLMGMIKAIENRPDCSNAACHAHPESRRILGVIDANVSLADVDLQLAQHRRHLVGFTISAMILSCLGSALFIWLFVHRPVKELMAGTHRVAGGDLGYRLPVRSQDELGDLAESFNKMTADLAAAQAEITAWTQTLEERVEKKTEELARAHDSLVDSEKMASLGKLAATVAHEVNNPLFGILTYARLVLKAVEKSAPEGPQRAEMIEHLRIIERESRRCGDIMKNLLTFARQAPSERALRDVNTLVERAMALVRHQYELQGIVLERRLAEPSAAAFCNAGQVQQVALAILVNAADAMPNGGQVTVSTTLATDYCELSIRDDGPGIPPDVLPHIFDPFFTTKEEQLRTGLGLAVARNIVEQHGGLIQARSKPGQGTEFLIRLPVAAPISESATAAGAGSPAGEPRR